MHNAAGDLSLVHETLRQRLVAINLQGLAGGQRFGSPRPQGVADIDHSFFDGDNRSFIVVVHAHIESGPAYRNDRGRGEDTVRIGLSAPLLDMDFHPSD